MEMAFKLIPAASAQDSMYFRCMPSKELRLSGRLATNNTVYVTCSFVSEGEAVGVCPGAGFAAVSVAGVVVVLTAGTGVGRGVGAGLQQFLQ